MSLSICPLVCILLRNLSMTMTNKSDSVWPSLVKWAATGDSSMQLWAMWQVSTDMLVDLKEYHRRCEQHLEQYSSIGKKKNNAVQWLGQLKSEDIFEYVRIHTISSDVSVHHLLSDYEWVSEVKHSQKRPIRIAMYLSKYTFLIIRRIRKTKV